LAVGNTYLNNCLLPIANLISTTCLGAGHNRQDKKSIQKAEDCRLDSPTKSAKKSPLTTPISKLVHFLPVSYTKFMLDFEQWKLTSSGMAIFWTLLFQWAIYCP
jgi:hypothetical protein